MLSLDVWNLAITIINLLVLYLLLKQFLFKPVTAVIEKRRALLLDQETGVQNARKQADDLKLQYEQKLEGAKEEAQKIVSQASEQAQLLYDRRLEQARLEAEHMLSKARVDVNLERERAMNQVQGQIGELVMQAVTKVAVGSGSGYDEFLQKAGDRDGADCS